MLNTKITSDICYLLDISHIYKIKLLTSAPLPTSPLLPFLLPPPLYLEREWFVLLAPDKPSEYNFCTKMKTHSPQIYFLLGNINYG